MLTIDIYADVLCGWAFVGYRRVKESLRYLDMEATVRWRPFLIDPSAPRPSTPLSSVLADPGVQEELSRCSPTSAAEPGRHPDLQESAAQAGIGPDWQPSWRANSWAAHRLILAANALGPDIEERAVEMLLQAHFSHGRDIARLDVLTPIATTLDLPPPLPADATTALAYMEPGVDTHDPVERLAREAQLIGQAIGVTTSPTFVVEGVVVATGAQPPEVLADAIRASAMGQSRTPEAVRQLRYARALLHARNPLGCLYLLEPLQASFATDPGVAALEAEALLLSGSVGRAQDALSDLLTQYPNDARLHRMMASALARGRDPEAARPHLALAKALGASACR